MTLIMQESVTALMRARITEGVSRLSVWDGRVAEDR